MTSASIQPAQNMSQAMIVSPQLQGLGATDTQISAIARGIIDEAGSPERVAFVQVRNAMQVMSDEDAQRLGQALIAQGVSATTVELAQSSSKFTAPQKVKLVWAGLSVVSSAVSGYHGYKRNQSVGWAIVWFMLGGLFPVLTPVVAVAQGFGKPKRG